MWESIQYVSSGLSLVAFVIAAAVWLAKSKIEERERLIQSANVEKRPDLVRSALEFFDVDTGGLTKEQQYELALAQIHARSGRFRVMTTAVCTVAFLLVGVTAYAIYEASRSPDQPKPGGEGKQKTNPQLILKEHRFISSDAAKIILANQTEWNYPDEIVRLGGPIYTNGHSLLIKARKIVSDGAKILAPSLNPAETHGQPGSNGVAGIDGTGAGQAGGIGVSGGPGGKGRDGVSQQDVRIEAEEFDGALDVSVSGQNGGRGGRGGDGGSGGNGAQGEASRPGVLDCASGPGHGGRGGDGGVGGKGGDGGAGETPGNVQIRISKRFSGAFMAQARGSVGGEAGEGGSGGRPGVGGPEGVLRGLCRSAGRNGAAGSPGVKGPPGMAGASKPDGQISIDLPNISTTVMGEYTYQSR